MIEIIQPALERGRIRYAMFDLDGTLSLIREGWQLAMAESMLVELLKTPCRESDDELGVFVAELISRTTGQTASYQMAQLAIEIHQRGGQPENSLVYKQRYVERLGKRINSRVEALKSGQTRPEDMMVPGALAILEAMRARGVKCYLASGTYEPYVLDETAALGIAPYFEGIYGAQDDPTRFSKRQLVDRLVGENHLAGCEFISFGDGRTEIEDTKSVGGIAIGVASNEATRIGIDEDKRERLIGAGADIIVPDFREHEQLVAYLFGE